MACISFCMIELCMKLKEKIILNSSAVYSEVVYCYSIILQRLRFFMDWMLLLCVKINI